MQMVPTKGWLRFWPVAAGALLLGGGLTLAALSSPALSSSLIGPKPPPVIVPVRPPVVSPIRP